MRESIRHVLAPQGHAAADAQQPITADPSGFAASRPALVLSGGGARAAYHGGVLAALTERLPEAQFPILTGVSAGAINSAYLAAHPGAFREAVEALCDEWLRITPDQVFLLRPASWFSSAASWSWQVATGRLDGPYEVRGMVDLQPLREFLAARHDPQRIDANIESGRLRAVAVSATGFRSGRSVSFVHGAPDAPIWERAHGVAVRARLTVEHLMASAAIPILFPPVRLEGDWYGDGGVKHTAPLAPAIHLGARSVVAIGMGAGGGAWPASPSGSGSYPTVAETLGLLFNSIFLDALEADAEQLDRVNRLLTALPADAARAHGVRPVDLLMLRPSRDLAEFAAGHVSLLPRELQFVVRALGGEREAAATFVSYLLFHRAFTSRLMELGYDDVVAHWPAIESFFARVERRP